MIKWVIVQPVECVNDFGCLDQDLEFSEWRKFLFSAKTELMQTDTVFSHDMQ